MVDDDAHDERGRRRWRSLLLLPVITAACIRPSCNPVERSDEGQYWFFVSAQDYLGDHTRRVLVGTRMSVEVADIAVPGDIDEDQGGLGCVSTRGSGVVEKVDEFYFDVTATGPGAVEFVEPSFNCPANTDVLASFGPDRWTIEGVAPEAVEARWVPEVDAWAAVHLSAVGPGEWPADFIAPADELLVVEGQPIRGAPVLLTMDEGEPVSVRYAADQITVDPAADYAELLLPDDDDDEDEDGEDEGEDSGPPPIPIGAVFSPEIEIAGHPFTLPTVRAVSPDAIVELELVAVYDAVTHADRELRDWGLPAFVIAVARDAEGRRVTGLPIEWSLHHGDLALRSDDGGPASVVETHDVCSPAPDQPRPASATISATLGELEASVDLEWIALPGDPRERGSGLCEQARHGCACATADGEAGGALWSGLALLGLVAWRRRRAPGLALSTRQ